MSSTASLGGLPTDRPPDGVVLTSFPKTKCSLWDQSSTGPSTCLHIGYYRKPKVCIPEKIIRIVQHQCENYGQLSHMFIGSLVVEDDGEGVQFQVDRLDTRAKIPQDGSGLAPGDMLIPLEVTNNTAKERLGSVEDYACAFKRLQVRCCSNDSVDLCSFLLLRGWGSFYSNAHTSVVHLDFDLVTMETVFKAIPITPVPIVLTALSKNLAGPMSLSHMQGSPKSGYLTMDHTRKLLLILESDPKTATLPIVGIWASGVEFIQHPFIWAACLRYIHSTHLQDRVCKPPEQFLLVLYSPLHSRPEFYQCCTISGDNSLKFQLCSGHEVTNMTKTLSIQNDNFTEVEMGPIVEGTKMEMFDAAKAKHGLSMAHENLSHGWSSGHEDIEPRSAPTPHMEKVPVFQPMVPDVSILWTEPPANFSTPGPSLLRHSHQIFANQTSSLSQQSSCSGPAQYRQGFLQHSTQPTIQVRPHLSQQHSHVPQVPQSCTPSVSSSWPSFQPQNQGSHGNVIHRPLSSGTESHTKPQMAMNSRPQPTHSFALPQQTTFVSGARIAPYGQLRTGQRYESPVPRVQMNPSTQPFSRPYLVNQTACANRMPGAIQFTSPPSAHAYPAQRPSAMTQSTPFPQPVMQNTSLQPPSQGQVAEASFGTSYSTTQHGVVHQSSPLSADTKQGNNNIQCLARPYGLASGKSSSGNNYSPMTFLKTVVEETSFSNSSVPSTSDESGSAGTKNVLNADKLSNGSNTGANNSSGSNTNSSSQSSDDDSGLSITPERLNPSPPEQLVRGSVAAAPSESVSAPLTSQPNMSNVNWDQIPPEIRTLLVQQNEQLKQLQEQIQLLLHNQSQQSAMSSSTSPRADIQNSSRITQVVPSRSVAVNTTTYQDDREREQSSKNCRDSRSVQTSPVKSPVCREMLKSKEEHTDLPPNGHLQTVARTKSFDLMPMAADHVRMDIATSVNKSSGEMSEICSEDDANQRDLLDGLADIPIYEHTINTNVSELMVDMPDYVSTVSDRSQPEQSPTSVSDYYGNPQDDSYSTVAEDATDPKQYYSQLMNNIQMFLTNSGSQDEDPSCTVATEADMSLHQTIATPRHTETGNTTLIPHINYISMILGCGSETGQSMEINAMAMKYLNDEQLTHMAKLRQTAPRDSQRSSYSGKILQRVINGWPSPSSNVCTPDVSSLGMSPCDMTIGTRNYLEKHGLLADDVSVPCSSKDLSVLDQMLTLKTDFSIVTSGSETVTEHLSTPTLLIDRKSAAGKLLTDQEAVPVMPAIRNMKAQPPNDENWLPSPTKGGNVPKDLGASPDLRAPLRYNGEQVSNVCKNRTKALAGKDKFGADIHDRHKINKRNVLQEMRPQGCRVRSPESHNSASTTTTADHNDEEENILDIEMLKQMPKLL